ncbi:hypothetical protein GDO86_000785 [Hymenochirus boettgeri]|uniref:ceramidase n=1 Tax=Hymenochirus boettgeri TaxID=247094 RepID=A0A8T2KFC5_9PIPI|nr:hypothetical protein GDO86_000785 [Hymenochirus boettgeri]
MALLCLLLLLGSCYLSYPSNLKYSAAPRYNISLDDLPEQRWEPVLKHSNYSHLKETANMLINTFIPEGVLEALQPLAKIYLTFYVGYPYAGEIRGISKIVGLSTTKVLLLNLVYEAVIYCTSIVAEDENGKVFMGRNMDFLFQKELAEIVVDVDFLKNGTIAYTATTFIGYIGILTGQSPHKFAISANSREQDSYWWQNAMAALLRNSSPISWVIRDTLSEAKDYTDALNKLSTRQLISDVFFILAGTKSGEGVVITRNRSSVADTRFLDHLGGKWFLVQTNYDPWNEPPKYDDRRTPATKAVNETGQRSINLDSLYKVVSVVSFFLSLV